MTIIADTYVDREFGTGAVKITPAHDKNDFEMGQRHGLQFINILTKDGKINEVGAEFAGQHRFTARFNIEKALTALGLMGEKKPITKKMLLPRCSRSKDVVEYMLLPQWYMNCKDLAADAISVVKSGEMELIPSFHDATWNSWLENIRDWCISRQLWWGHQIPAYKVVKPTPDQETWVAARSEEEAIGKAREKLGLKADSECVVYRDDDVLDTWFSSGLFPFSTMGWPDKTADMDAFFPGALLETGHDILFFWVARMVMMSRHLTGKVPFKKVYLHAMVRDAQGRKMSKSLGNVIDPLDVISGITLAALHEKLKDGLLPEKEIKIAMAGQKKDFPNGIPECGADALRYGLLAYTKQGRNVNLDVQRVVGYRFFCNKLWNAMKFALMNFPAEYEFTGLDDTSLHLDWMDRWILHRLTTCAKLTNEAMEAYMFSDAVTSTYNFWLYEFCDIYLESLKGRISSTDKDSSAEQKVALDVLFTCLDTGLRLLHPLLPFVTEELYHRLPKSTSKAESICVAPYPQYVASWHGAHIDDEMSILMLAVKEFRSLCSQLGIPNTKPMGSIRLNPSLILKSGQEASVFMEQRLSMVALLAKMEKVTLLPPTSDPENCVGGVIGDKGEIFVDATQISDLSGTFGQVVKKIVVARKTLDGYLDKMKDEHYETRVPEDVRNQNVEKVEQLNAEIAGLNATSLTFTKLLGEEKAAEIRKEIEEGVSAKESKKEGKKEGKKKKANDKKGNEAPAN
eukprot:Selendium_serpulae@DN5202_c0_g1_i7.p1